MRTKPATCASKVRYKTKARAVRDASRIGRSLVPYRCNCCRKWHLTGIKPGTLVLTSAMMVPDNPEEPGTKAMPSSFIRRTVIAA